MRQTTRSALGSSSFGGLVILVLLGLLVGCGPDEQIETYTLDKPASDDADNPLPKGHPAIGTIPLGGPAAEPAGPAVDQRLLGAIIPRGQQYWFFKATGPADALAPHADAFTTLVKSIKFGEDATAPPTWDLPEGWQQQPGAGMRLATIKLDSANPTLEISVIPLSFGGDDADAYVLQNVNRWRAQVGMPPIAAEKLADETASVELDGTKAIIVDVTGKAGSDGMHPTGMGPAGMGPAGMGPAGLGGFHGN
jgi:hypothetical protein